MTNPLYKITRLLIDRKYLECLRYVHRDSSKGEWFFFNGKRWGEDINKEHESAIKRFYYDHVGYKPTDPAYIADLPKLSACQQWNNILRIARTEPEITCSMGSFNSNLELINLGNGSYDLEEDKFREHQAGDMMTKMMACDYEPEAKCTRFIDFLDEIFCSNDEVIGFMHRFLGYSLSSSTMEQCFMFLHGQGSNGKSVLTELLDRIFGDYSKKVSNQMVTKSRRGSERDRQDQIMSILKDVRLVFATETGRNMQLDESHVKDVTGGESVICRDLYSSYESYKPIFKFVMSGNYKPVINGTDKGIWRRIRLVNFERTFSGDEIDPRLLDKLLLERNGIFLWLLEGYRKWRKDGLGELPDCMKRAVDEYRSDMDILGQYIEDRLIRDRSAATETELIYRDYKSWVEENGYYKPLAKRTLTNELIKRGYERDGSNIHKPIILGVKLENS